jgi:glycosyltransferase involved in cell wall biosynthesis
MNKTMALDPGSQDSDRLLTKVALVHYWIVGQRGGEAVLDALAGLFPSAALFAHVIRENVLTPNLRRLERSTTFISRMPFAEQLYRLYLPLMPLALEALDVNDYDLIISSEAGPAKWIIPRPDAVHICYCHSPLRYIWDQRGIYEKNIPALLRPLGLFYGSHLRKSDALSSLRVDHFVANSNYVAARINKYYRRDSYVVHPPVRLDFFNAEAAPEDFYLIAGEIRGYKKIDHAIRACIKLNRKLVVIGGGEDGKLRAIASPLIDFRGRVSSEELRDTLSRCRALLFPGVEDFGIVPVEAMASGRPVIAYGHGGAVDTVVHGETGILYNDPSVEGLVDAMRLFERNEQSFSPRVCVEHAQKFSPQKFRDNMLSIVSESLKDDRRGQFHRFSA